MTRPRRLLKCIDRVIDEINVQIPDRDKNIVWININQSRPNSRHEVPEE